jgi:hypothetical protein
MMEINTTPLIDVMLVLIIVLIMSIPVMTHATKLDMPQTNNPPPPVRRSDPDRHRLRRHDCLERYGGQRYSSARELFPLGA